MPPKATSRLDLLVLPEGEMAPVAAQLVAAQLGPTWLAHDEDVPRFLCNERGGFRVKCPETGVPTPRQFARGLQQWREGGTRDAICACGGVHPLPAFVLEPPGGFARSWLQRVNVLSADPDPQDAAIIERYWPNFRLLAVRP